jgi:ribonucleoside-triphosphate reductase (formate)
MSDEAETTVRVPCLVYSRVVGFLRPVQYWNDAKQQEFKERKVFTFKAEEEEKEED